MDASNKSCGVGGCTNTSLYHVEYARSDSGIIRIDCCGDCSAALCRELKPLTTPDVKYFCRARIPWLRGGVLDILPRAA